MAVAARSGTGFGTRPLALLGDERLARLAAAGHERAFAVVYERHQQALYRYCRSILRNDADAQDALQSTFTAAFAALGRGRPDAPIRPWLFRIAHNEAVSALRRRRPTAELSAAADYGTASVEDQVAERAELDLLLRDLRELHERQRSALVMRELSGLSHDEIALALQTSVGAAKQAIYEARRSLFEFAEGRAMSCDEIQRMISDADGRLLRGRRVRAHLRECPACAAFTASIPARREQLRALVPTLPALAAAGSLERVAAGAGAGAGGGHGAGAGLGGLVTGAAGKVAGASLAANALAGVALVASATVGVTIGVDRLAHMTAHGGAAHHLVPAARSAPAASRRPTVAVSSGTGAISRRSAHAPLPGRASVAARTSIPSRAGRPAATSTAAATAPGHSGAAPGHSTETTTAPGHSGAAPGHSSKTTTSRGHSAAAPGHSTKTATSRGDSAAAPGHSTSTSTSTSRGHSASAPGHTHSPVVSLPPVASVPAVPVTAATVTGKSVPPGQRK